MNEPNKFSIFALILVLIIVLVLIQVLFRPRYKRNKLDKLCTEEIEGEIIKIESKHKSDFVTVCYKVHEEEYQIREKIMVRYESVISKNILMYRQSVPVIGDYDIGQKLIVKYNPNNPKQALIRENISLLNI